MSSKRAANIRQGYVHDAVLEAANARYVAGDIATEEFHRRDAGAPSAPDLRSVN
ncbi:hypothetical protein I6F15_23395 [Bradyrhizobium sp. BRP14]|nr:hypothetical protein [Bradyrhizobium sp. BRP14]